MRLAHEAREQRGERPRVELVEHAREDDLRGEELVGRRELARDAPLVRDDALLREVAQPAQHLPPRLELVRHQHRLDVADLAAQRALLRL